jgi:predicted ATPase/DNA-binding CsgD family transcriptional regulator
LRNNVLEVYATLRRVLRCGRHDALTVMAGRRPRAEDTLRVAAGRNADPTAGSPRTHDARLLTDDLPLELTSFVGRERELAELRELLDDTRLLTITGPGGSGKTRLALRVAAELAVGFDDGARWVELAALSDPDLVPQRVASALGVRETPGRRVDELLVEYLGPKAMLLVLDNCEHLVEGCAGLADALLRACPRLRLVATSREPLGVAGEISWPAPPLSLPDTADDVRALGDLLRYEAVRLFVERAAAALPGFALTAENAPAVARICERLDGMPLAIELAASRVRALSPRQILDRLDDRFRILTSGGRISVPRHRTLKATMDWSHELLSEEEKVFIRRLSVFAGGWTLEAAEAVCAGDGIAEVEVLDLLSRLVDKSLVVVREWDGEARYRLLETVRQYGREKLEESGEEGEVRRRHAGYFLELAETAEVAMSGLAQEAWVERLGVEHDNFRAALDWGEEHDTGATEARLLLAAALSQFWVIRGLFAEGLSRLETLLALPAASGRNIARAKAWYALGSLYYRHGDHAAGDFVRARACYEESLEIFRELGSQPQIAVALADLGRVNADLGEYTSSRSLLEESLVLQRRLGNEHGIAVGTYALGWLDFLRGEYASARPLLEEGLAIFRRVGDKFQLGGCVLYLGCLDCEQGNYAAARSRFVELTRLVSFQQYRYVAPLVVEAFVILAATQGQAARALRLAGAAAELRRGMGAQFRLGWQRYVARRVVSARESLTEEAAAAAWAEGQKMTLEQTLAYALVEGPTVVPSQQAQGPPEPPAGSLSVRELEVLGLVAEGLTDAGVAERLHLSPRTVGRHLESVYRKLGVSSRTAAVKRVGELGLL